jgi:hypothetical protein
VTLGVIWASVTLEIAAGDEVDKKGSFEDQLLYIKKYLTLRPGNAHNLYRGADTCDLNSCRDA